MFSSMQFRKFAVTSPYAKTCRLWVHLTFGLPEKRPYLEFFWSVFSRIQTEYEEIRSISPYSVQMPENTDQKISEYGYFSRSVGHLHCFNLQKGQIPATKKHFSGSSDSFSFKASVAWVKISKKRKKTGWKTVRNFKTLNDMVIGTVTLKRFELFTIFQNGENNETGKIWAFHAASGIFR